jgi:hypothetical protein
MGFDNMVNNATFASQLRETPLESPENEPIGYLP